VSDSPDEATDCANVRVEQRGQNQLYDDRGHPFNPGSKAHAQILREAQNRLLEIVGVVERKSAPPAPDRRPGTSCFPEDRLGDWSRTVATVGLQLSTLSLMVPRHRLLVFDTPLNVPVIDMLHGQLANSNLTVLLLSAPWLSILDILSQIITAYLPHVRNYLLDGVAQVTCRSRSVRTWYDNTRMRESDM